MSGRVREREGGSGARQGARSEEGSGRAGAAHVHEGGEERGDERPVGVVPPLHSAVPNHLVRARRRGDDGAGLAGERRRRERRLGERAGRAGAALEVAVVRGEVRGERAGGVQADDGDVEAGGGDALEDRLQGHADLRQLREEVGQGERRLTLVVERPVAGTCGGRAGESRLPHRLPENAGAHRSGRDLLGEDEARGERVGLPVELARREGKVEAGSFGDARRLRLSDGRVRGRDCSLTSRQKPLK